LIPVTDFSPNPTPFRARTLRDAYRLCSVEPLSGERLRDYYVDLSRARDKEAIEGVNTSLEFAEPGEFKTILFTGHRGCGKSTELKRIQRQWEANYRVIYLEITDEIDVNDAEYTDLYLVVIKCIELELRKLKLKFDPKLLHNFEQWFKDVTEEDERSVEASISVDAEASLGGEVPFLAKLLVKLLAQIKGSDKRKKTIRQTLQKDISRLKTDINLLLLDAFNKVKAQYPKGFLIVLDNLDRVPPNVGNHLFFDYAAQLQELNCTMIYTVPISVLSSPKNLSNSFENPHLVSMIGLYQLDRANQASCELGYRETGVEVMTQIIQQRVEIAEVFASQAPLLDLVKASGGHVRQLMRMMQQSCMTAQTRGHSKIQPEDAAHAIKQLQFEFERFIPETHYPLLAKVCVDKNVTKDDIGQLMLFNTSVLEYNGTDRWNYPNPVVLHSELFRTALRTLTGG
jgi:energy-coupling factor transporter ATP-binding protein EcfA2